MKKSTHRRMQISDEVFIRDYETIGLSEMARKYDFSMTAIRQRRRELEVKLKREIVSPRLPGPRTQADVESSLPLPHVPVNTTGLVLVGGDAHYWPGVNSVGHRAFVKFARELKPKVVIFNGDALDAASISRFPPIGWEEQPTLVDELNEVQARLGEIVDASPRARHIWPLGNHDARFNTRLASVTPEFRGVEGTRLVHHFPKWEPCWSCELNGEVVVKHRFRAGDHATQQNTMRAGRSIVTGHLHSLRVTPFTDYNGTRWGVDSGTLADPYGPQFAYQENNPRNHVSGFCVLTFHKGRLLWPEVVSVYDEKSVVFRGEVIRV